MDNNANSNQTQFIEAFSIEALQKRLGENYLGIGELIVLIDKNAERDPLLALPWAAWLVKVALTKLPEKLSKLVTIFIKSFTEAPNDDELIYYGAQVLIALNKTEFGKEIEDIYINKLRKTERYNNINCLYSYIDLSLRYTRSRSLQLELLQRVKSLYFYLLQEDVNLAGCLRAMGRQTEYYNNDQFDIDQIHPFSELMTPFVDDFSYVYPDVIRRMANWEHKPTEHWLYVNAVLKAAHDVGTVRPVQRPTQ